MSDLLKIVREKAVQQFGNGLGIYLTSEFQELGIQKGDKVYVMQVGDKLIISKNNDNSIKPVGVKEDVWHLFLVASQMKKKKGKINQEDLIDNLNEALLTWVDEQRTLIKIEIPILKKDINGEIDE